MKLQILWILLMMVCTIFLQLFKWSATVYISKLFFIWSFQNKRNRLIFSPNSNLSPKFKGEYPQRKTILQKGVDPIWISVNYYQPVLATPNFFDKVKKRYLKLTVDWNWKRSVSLVYHLHLWIRPEQNLTHTLSCFGLMHI